MESKKRSSIPVIVVCVIVYIMLLVLQNTITRQGITFLNGVISQVQNIVVVIMTVKAQKKGFIASTVVNLLSFAQALITVIHSSSALPGVFIPLVMILMSYLIYSYSNKMNIANDELSKTIDELNKTNANLVEKDKTLMHMAYHDILTGLGNKHLLVETIDNKITNKPNEPFCLIELNVDNMREITNRFGMNTADEIIFYYAEKIKGACENKYEIFSFNNERFVLLVDGRLSANDVQGIANTINNATREPIVIKDTGFKTTISYGVACYPDNANNSERLIQCINTSVDLVILNGGNNINFYNNQSVYL